MGNSTFSSSGIGNSTLSQDAYLPSYSEKTQQPPSNLLSCKYTLDKQTKQINVLCESSNKQIKKQLDMCNNEKDLLHKKLNEIESLGVRPPDVIKPLPTFVINPKILAHEPSSELLCGHIDDKNNTFIRSKCSILDPNMMQAAVMPTELLLRPKQNPLSCLNKAGTGHTDLQRGHSINYAMLKHAPSYTPQNKGPNGKNRVWTQVPCDPRGFTPHQAGQRPNPYLTLQVQMASCTTVQV